MADIFVSWTKKNEAVVKPLVRKLKKLGFDLYTYDEDAALGNDLVKEVQRAIAQAHLALICFEDETHDAQWIVTEVSWCDSAVDKGTMAGIIPVWIGPHPQNKVPKLLENRYAAFDLEQSTPAKINELVKQVMRLLPGEERHIVYGAIYAMTAVQFKQVKEEDPSVGELTFSEYLDKVCAYLGMPSRPELLDLLELRYRDTPEDMRPFQQPAPPAAADPTALPESPTILDIVETSIGDINNDPDRDPAAKKVYVRWVREELADVDAVRDEVVPLWEAGDSLLIVDALSLFSKKVRGVLRRLPSLADSSIVWIPPFTQRTGTLTPMLDKSWGMETKLRDEFVRWRDRDSSRNVTCEATTELALGRWLHRTFAQVEGESRPVGKFVRDVKKKLGTSGVSPNKFFRRTSR